MGFIPSEDAILKAIGIVRPKPEQAIDLGLPSGTLWAPWQLGAKPVSLEEIPGLERTFVSKRELEGVDIWRTNLSDCGQLFAWGEGNIKARYDLDNYEPLWQLGNWYPHNMHVGRDYYDLEQELSNSPMQLCGGNGAPFVDATTANWRSDWRMPTAKELQELVRYTVKVPFALGKYKGIFLRRGDVALYVPQGTVQHGLKQKASYQLWTAERFTNSDSYMAKTVDVNTVDASIKPCQCWYGLPILPVLAR